MLEKSKEFFKKKLDSFSIEDVEILQNLIKFHSDLYYNKQAPIISDKEYDELFRKLEFLEDKFCLEEKTTLLVGAELVESSFEKIKHSRPMISLDNTYNEDDLNDFDKRVKKLINNEEGIINSGINIKKARSKKDYDKCFDFFNNFCKEEFKIDLSLSKRNFYNDVIFYIKKNNELLSALQIERFSEEYIKKENLSDIVNIGDFYFGRIANLNSSGGKEFSGDLINFGINFLKDKGKKKVFMPSLIKNNSYYSKFGFEKFGKEKKSGNTKIVWMKLDLKNKLEYMIEFKFDGIGIEIIYKNGKFIQAITRGNGVEGEDVTENVRQINSIPKNIYYKGNFEIRGEVVMPISSFKKLNEQNKKSGNKIFSNPRNASSGSIRMIDNRVTKERDLDFYGYDLANNHEFAKQNNINTYEELIKKIDDLGFKTSSYFEKCKDIKEVIKKIENISDIKKNLDFEVDGFVIKLNNIILWDEIGYTEHHPRYAISYKFPAEIFTTKILSVEHSVGRTGTITPVANLVPVNIGGVIIKRATLHNYDEIESLGVKIGDNVFIKRAGGVIPKVVSVIEDARVGDEKDIIYPKKCPTCGEKVFKDKNKVRYYCGNYSICSSQIKERLIFALGRQGLNINGLGRKQVELFLKLGIISDLVSVFNIKNKIDKIMKLEGFQKKSVNNLINAIEDSKNISIVSFLNSLGIPGVGNKTAKILSRIITSSDNHIFRGDGDVKELEKLYDIGTETAKNIMDFFSDANNRKLVNDLTNILNIKYSSVSVTQVKDRFFFGKKVCITGSFENYKRDGLIKLLEENGGEFISSVSKKTNYLLAGEKSGSKLEKAKKLGVKVLNLKEFLEKIDLK